MQNHNIDALVKKFSDLVILKAEHTKNDDFSKANTTSRKLAKVFSDVLQHGHDGRDALIALVDSPNDDVALMAAVYSLRHDPDRCKVVLTRLSSLPDMRGFGAAQSIRNWDDGSWALEDGFRPTLKSKPERVEPSAQVIIQEIALRDDFMGQAARDMIAESAETDEQLIERMLALEKKNKRNK